MWSVLIICLVDPYQSSLSLSVGSELRDSQGCVPLTPRTTSTAGYTTTKRQKRPWLPLFLPPLSLLSKHIMRGKTFHELRYSVGLAAASLSTKVP